MTDTTLIWTILFIIVMLLFIWWALRRARCWEMPRDEQGEYGYPESGSAEHGGTAGPVADAVEDTTARADQPSVEVDDRPAAPPPPTAARGPDDLTVIRGIGNVIAPKLHALGITTFEDIANFTAEDIARVGAHLNFKGRIQRERWVEQAREIVRQRNA